jgi:pyridoxamine 5'-phosphate oxidase family protein
LLEAEIKYLASQKLGRLATIGRDGVPQNSPVGYSYNEELGTIDIFGWDMAASRKYRNIQANPNIAFVVDDVVALDPWEVRGLEIRGWAETPHDPVAAQRWRDRIAAATYRRVREFPATDDVIRLHPVRVYSWGVLPGTVGIQRRVLGNRPAGK